MKRRLYALLAFLLLTLSAHAAPLSERSLFVQGHWWNEARPGSGLELFHSAGQAMLIWYTYDNDRNPVWYTAQGPVDSIGSSWALMKHRWTSGRHGGAETVGSVKIAFPDPQNATLDFRFDAGGAGTWSLRPFMLSGRANEVDHTGSWFDATNSGWGVTVTEQGEVLGGVIYTYDPAGAPTWVAGFDRNRRDVEMFSFRGACPACPFMGSTPTTTGRVSFDFESETRLKLGNAPSLPMAAGVRVDGVTLGQIGRPASTRPADRTLATFGDAASLKSYLARGLFNTYSGGGGVDFSAAPPSSSSGTNVVQPGVDETDEVKGDGEYLYTYARDGMTRHPRVRIARVGDQGRELSVQGEVTLSGESIAEPTGGLMLHGDRLVSIHGTGGMSLIWGPARAANQRTYVEILDASQRATPKSVWRMRLEGGLITGRRVGDLLYLVTRFVPAVPGFTTYAAGAMRTPEAANAVPLADLLPKREVNGAAPEPAVDFLSVYLPPQGDRRPTAEVTHLTVVDVTAARIVQSLAIAGPIDSVYASTSNLYLASTRYNAYSLYSGLLLPQQPSFVTTDIHQLQLTATGLRINASGSVEGTLAEDLALSPFRMSESNGKLRVVSTARSAQWGAGIVNRLTVLEAGAAGVLKTVSVLPNDKRPDPLGKPNEVLRGTRFIGDRLYAVTFRQTDPLYVVDLSNAADPRITGALEVPGFSDYLHPLPNGRLLGVGRDATFQGVQQGLQLTLFDVSADGRPLELQRIVVGKRGTDSALLKTHHAFSALTRADGTLSFAVPVRVHDGFSPMDAWSSYPWLQSEVLRFDVGAGARALEQRASLVTEVGNPHRYPPSYDPMAYDGRSVIFPQGIVFVGGGRFWLQDDSGARKLGPL